MEGSLSPVRELGRGEELLPLRLLMTLFAESDKLTRITIVKKMMAKPPSQNSPPRKIENVGETESNSPTMIEPTAHFEDDRPASHLILR